MLHCATSLACQYLSKWIGWVLLSWQRDLASKRWKKIIRPRMLCLNNSFPFSLLSPLLYHSRCLIVAAACTRTKLSQGSMRDRSNKWLIIQVRMSMRMTALWRHWIICCRRERSIRYTVITIIFIWSRERRIWEERKHQIRPKWQHQRSTSSTVKDAFLFPAPRSLTSRRFSSGYYDFRGIYQSSDLKLSCVLSYSRPPCWGNWIPVGDS